MQEQHHVTQEKSAANKLRNWQSKKSKKKKKQDSLEYSGTCLRSQSL